MVQLLNNIKFRGSTARINFSLAKLPKIKGINNNQMDSIFSVSPSIEYLERAYDDAKYGRISDSPFIEFTFPSVHNPDFAPEGKHVLSATVQYIPYHIHNGKWNKELRNQVIHNVTSIVEKYMPGFTKLVENGIESDRLIAIDGGIKEFEIIDKLFYSKGIISIISFYCIPIKK